MGLMFAAVLISQRSRPERPALTRSDIWAPMCCFACGRRPTDRARFGAHCPPGGLGAFRAQVRDASERRKKNSADGWPARRAQSSPFGSEQSPGKDGQLVEIKRKNDVHSAAPRVALTYFAL